MALGFLSAAYAATGDVEKARAVVNTYLKKKPRLTISRYPLLRNYKRKQDKDRFTKLLRKAGMPEHPPLKLPDRPSIAIRTYPDMSLGWEFFHPFTP